MPAPAPPGAATRRQFLTLLGAAGLLTACGADTPSGAGSDRRTVRSVDGTAVEVPAAPQRVVVADQIALPLVLELGVVPVAAGAIDRQYTGFARHFPPELYPLGAGGVTAFARDEPDDESIAALRPDLVLGTDFVLTEKRADYARLAPTVVYDESGPITDDLRALGEILGRPDRAAQLVATAEARLAELSARPPAVATLSLVNPVEDGSAYVWTENEPTAALVARTLGVRLSPTVEELRAAGNATEPGSSSPISAELLGLLGGEALAVLSRFDAGDVLAANPLWANLPAVRAGRVADVGDFGIFYGVSGIGAFTDQVARIGELVSPR